VGPRCQRGPICTSRRATIEQPKLTKRAVPDRSVLLDRGDLGPAGSKTILTGRPRGAGRPARPPRRPRTRTHVPRRSCRDAVERGPQRASAGARRLTGAAAGLGEEMLPKRVAGLAGGDGGTPPLRHLPVPPERLAISRFREGGQEDVAVGEVSFERRAAPQRDVPAVGDAEVSPRRTSSRTASPRPSPRGRRETTCSAGPARPGAGAPRPARRGSSRAAAVGEPPVVVA